MDGGEWPSSPEAHGGVKLMKIGLIFIERTVGARRRAGSSSCVVPFNEFRPIIRSEHRRTSEIV